MAMNQLTIAVEHLISHVIKINLMHYLSLINFVIQPLHISGVIIAHHQDVFTVYVQQLVLVRLGYWQLVGSGWINSASICFSLQRLSRCTVSKT
jgi:hypothetical protein